MASLPRPEAQNPYTMIRSLKWSFRQTKTPLNAYMRRLQYRPPCE